MKFYNWLGKKETTIAKAALVFMTILVFVQAMLRKFGHPISWAVDISTFLFAWVVFLGADAAMRRDALVSVDLFVKKFSEKTQMNIRIINQIIIIGYFLAMIIYGIKLTITTYHRSFAGLPWLSFSWATASVPFGCLLMLMTAVLKTKDIIKEGRDMK
jgi:TRAP-type C4-dicarboxylate transport system permease small subunit